MAKPSPMPTSRLLAGIGLTGGEGKFPKQHKAAVRSEGRMLLGQQNKSPLQIANLSIQVR